MARYSATAGIRGKLAMMTDEEIERRRAALGPLIGPTRAGWYAEACKAEAPPGQVDTSPAGTLWACRFREMAVEAGELAELVLHCWAVSGCPNCGYDQMTQRQKELFDLLVEGAA